jgi:hypothetical protein
MCPDGRDQRRLDPPHWNKPPSPGASRPETSQPRWLNILIAALVSAVVALTISMCSMARAMDHGFDPNSPTTKWFEALLRPDTGTSCCGKGDAYPVNDYWPNPDGTWTAVIADGSAIKFPDGTYREYLPTGEKVIVPADKVNEMIDDLDNPTDRSWIFVRALTGNVENVYCFVRHPQGN